MFEDEKNLEGVTDDDVTAPDDTTATTTEAKDMTDEELSAALKAVKDTPATTEEPAQAEAPKAEEKPAEPAKPETPVVDIEAEVEKRLATKRAELEAEWTKREQEKIQKAIDSVIAKERKREESAIRREREFKARTGLTYEEAAAVHATREVERLMTEEGLPEPAARRLVEAQQKAALLETQEADRKREHQETQYTMAYRTAKLDFLANKDAPDIYKKALQKYGDEIDTFANHGRPDESGTATSFDVAMKFIAGQHLPEIVAELNKEAEAKLQAKAQEIESVRKATEQKVIRDVQNRGKAAPETSTAGVAPPEASLTPMEIATAKAFGMTPAQYAKAKTNVNPRSKS